MLIYKYMPTARFFTNFKLRFTPPSALADPLELIPEIRLRDPDGCAQNVPRRDLESAISLFQQEHPNVPLAEIRTRVALAAKILESLMRPQAKAREHFHMFMSVTNPNIGVLSLTTDPGSAPMWSHYADKYSGLAVGFDSESNFFRPAQGEPKHCGELVRVTYTNTPPVAYVEPGKIGFSKELFFTKAECWSYENEWRVIKYLLQAHEVLAGPNGIPIHLFKVPPDAIKEVIFGFRMSPVARAAVEMALAEFAPHVERKMIEFLPNVGLRVVRC
ncbi:DUF2971 domain-containing protein [Pandoraea captiosa]|nr:DUF2971 domain-containing protein [Pandoraea captiosa]